MGLDNEDIEYLRGLGHRRSVPRGTALCYEGDRSSEVFLIESGSVRIVMSPPSGRELILCTREAGHLVGEFAAFDGRPRSASVVANEPTVVVVIPGRALRLAVEQRHSLSSYLLTRLTLDVRSADLRTLERVSDDLPTRVAGRLVSLADAAIEHGQAGLSGVVSLGVRQSDLAGWVGSSREAVARILADLRRSGVLMTRRGGIDILDLANLRSRAHS